jgi:site-specific DNA recombinase
MKGRIIEVASARSTGRKLFNEMVERLKKEVRKKPENRIDTILTEKTDRLVRNHADKETLLDLGVTLHMVKEMLVIRESSSSNEHYIFDNNVSNASRYSRNLSEETIKGMNQKASDGYYPSNAPFGYINVTRADKSKIIEPDPVRGPIVAAMFNHYASTKYSLETIKEYANGELKKAGLLGNLPKSSVAHILKNPIYYGEFTWNGRMYIGKHKPLLSRELFDSVNSVSSENNTHVRHAVQKHEWLFKGLLFCTCGCAMVGEIKKGKYIYYHCTGNRAGCDRKGHNIRQEVVEQHVINILENFKQVELPFKETVDLVKGHQRSLREDRENELVRLRTEIDSVERRRHKLLLKSLDEKIDDQRFCDADKLLGDSLAEFRARAEHLSQDDSIFVESEDRIKQLLMQAPQLYRQQHDKKKRHLISCLFTRCVWDDNRLHPTFRKPFNRYMHV